MSEDDDHCGFGEALHDTASDRRPPRKDTRFKKGQSGNPRGRPKGSGSLRADLDAELGQLVEITESNGRRRKVTKRRLLARQLTTGAIKGDARLAGVLLRILASVALEEPSAPAPTPLSADDKAVLAAYLQRHAQTSAKED